MRNAPWLSRLPLWLATLLATFFIATIAASQQQQTQPHVPTKLTPEEMQACRADGGRLTARPLSGDQICIRPMADGGKACADGAECQSGYCVLDTETLGFKHPKPRAQAVGICKRTDGWPSCSSYIVEGRVIGGVCE
jgi:hypothetical protein